MKKRILSALLCLIMVFTVMATAIPAQAAAAKEFTVTPDKTTVYPGDTLPYTVSIGAIKHLQSINFTLVIPEGLIYGVGKEVSGLNALLGADKAEYTDSTKTFVVSGGGDYSSTGTTKLMTFTCKVADNAKPGDYKIALEGDEFFGNTEWTDLPVTVNMGASKVTVAEKSSAATTVGTLEISGVTPPAIGATPDMSVTLPGNCGYTQEDLAWYESSTQPGSLDEVYEGSNMASSKKFQAGKWYTITFTARPKNGYSFTDPVAGKVNGSNANAERLYSFATVYYSFFCDYKAVTSVAVSGVTAPVKGQQATYQYAVPGGAGYAKDMNSADDACFWSETSAKPGSWSEVWNGKKYYASDSSKLTFAEGKYYTFVATLATDTTSVFGSVNATVNGSAAQVSYHAEDDTHANVYYTFYCEEANEEPTVESIEIVSPPNKVVYTSGEKLDLTGLKVRVWMSDGFFDSVNGDKLEITKNPLITLGEQKIKVSYQGVMDIFIVTVIPAETTGPVYDLTTSVEGGHGTVTAGQTGIADGTTITVIFTPDEGYELDKVTVNGEEKGVLANVLDVKIDKDTYVVASFKKIADGSTEPPATSEPTTPSNPTTGTTDPSEATTPGDNTDGTTKPADGKNEGGIDEDKVSPDSFPWLWLIIGILICIAIPIVIIIVMKKRIAKEFRED